MANLEGMPIGSLPELTGDLQDEDEVVVYRPSTGKAYQANTDLIDSYSRTIITNITQMDSLLSELSTYEGRLVFFNGSFLLEVGIASTNQNHGKGYAFKANASRIDFFMIIGAGAEWIAGRYENDSITALYRFSPTSGL